MENYGEDILSIRLKKIDAYSFSAISHPYLLIISLSEYYRNLFLFSKN